MEFFEKIKKIFVKPKKKVFNVGLVKQAKEQDSLRDKHKIEREDVIVVEKSTTAKSLLNAAGGVVRVLAAIIVICLAVIGLLVLVYPETRAAVVKVLQDTWEQIWGMNQ